MYRIASALRSRKVPLSNTRFLNGKTQPQEAPKAVATPQSKGSSSFPLIATATLATIVGFSVLAEQDKQFSDKLNEYLPASGYVLDPIRFAIRAVGLVDQPKIEPPKVTKEVPKHEVKSKIEQPLPVVPKTEVAKTEVVETPVVVEVPEPQPPQVPVEEVEALIKEDLEQTADVPTVEAVPVEENIQSDNSTFDNKQEEDTKLPASTNSTLPPVSAESDARKLSSHYVSGTIEDLVKQSMLLRKELEQTLLYDLNSLDEHGLRGRITQLASELFERITWEGIRLNNSLKQVETELGYRYDELMKKQREELEFEIKRILLEKDREVFEKTTLQKEELVAKYEERLNKAIIAKAEEFNATLQHKLEEQKNLILKELSEQFVHEVAIMRQAHVQELTAVQSYVSDLNANWKAINHVIDETAEAIQLTMDSHVISSAVLALELALITANVNQKNSNMVAKHFHHLKHACKGDQLVISVLNTLPSTVLTEGALTISELQVRFNVMRDEVRKAALAPENAPKMLGQLIGTVLAAISFTPKGYVTGQGTEEILSRAGYYLERGLIRESLKELDSVQGYPQLLMTDFKRLAHDRMVVDQTLKVLKAGSVLRHKAFA